jgi:hypothetical protein
LSLNVAGKSDSSPSRSKTKDEKDKERRQMIKEQLRLVGSALSKKKALTK